MFSLGDVFIAFLFASVLLVWWNAQGANQIARQATRAYCEQQGVQLLDDAVALRGFWVKRDDRGRLLPWRSYNFEFTSTGNERYRGRVMLLGRKVEQFQLDPHRLN